MLLVVWLLLLVCCGVEFCDFCVWLVADVWVLLAGILACGFDCLDCLFEFGFGWDVGYCLDGICC